MSVAVSTGDLSGGGLVTLVSTFTKPNIHCPGPLQTSLQASYTTHTNFSPAQERFRRALSVEGLDQRRWGNVLTTNDSSFYVPTQ